jgi:hypothetical protein
MGTAVPRGTKGWFFVARFCLMQAGACWRGELGAAGHTGGEVAHKAAGNRLTA